MSAGAEPLVRKTVTVLFCDVVGSTGLGERVDPEAMRRVMLRYFDEMRAVLERHGGTVEKFIGDAVMAVFGVPVLHEDDAFRAVRAASEMRAALATLNEELHSRWGLQLDMRIGINTGEVVVGAGVGSQTMATGDTVNVAARLQQAAQPGQVLLGRETYRLVREQVSAGPLQAFALKGKSERVAPWQLDQVHERATGMLRRLDEPFVDREDARSRLDHSYAEAVAAERCRQVTIVGAPGIGKTRLAQEFASRLLAADVFQGRCLPYGDGITFWPLTEIVRAAADIEAGDSAAAARAKVARLLPPGGDSQLVCDRVCATIGLADDETRAEESFWAVRRLFESRARGRPLVLAFEDLHWAEPMLLDLIEYLVGWSSGSPILLVCIARPELLELRPSWAAEAIALEPLSDDHAVELAGNTLTGGVLDPDAAGRVAEAAGGNPLFAEEFVRMLVEEGDLALDDGVWAMQRDLATLRIPPTITALLAARLDRLPRAERLVMQAASVVGKEFPWSAVVELAPDEVRTDVATPLHALVRKRVIEPAGSAALTGDDSFRFTHILMRDAAYASLAKSERSALHERYATWLSARAGERAIEVEEILGYHYEQAYVVAAELGHRDPEIAALAEKGCALLAAAGRRALDRGDAHAAAALLRRAVSLSFDEAVKAALTRDLGFALMEAGLLEEADAVLTSTIEAAEAGDPDLAAHAAVVRGYVRFRTDATGALDETQRVAEEAIQTFTKLGDHRGLAYAWRLLSITRAWRAQFGSMEEALREALVHARSARDAREEAAVTTWLNTAIYYGPTTVLDAIRHCEQVLTSAAGNRVVEALTSCQLCGLLAMTGRFEEARELGARGIALLEELDLRVRLGHCRLYVADAEQLAGDLRAAEEELRFAYATLEAIGDRSGSLAAAYELAGVLCSQGRDEEAEQWIALGRDARERGDVMLRVSAHATAARLAARQGRVYDAERDVRTALELAEQTDVLNMKAATFLASAEVCGASNRRAEARDAAGKALRLYEAKGNVAAAAQAREAASAAAVS